MLPSLDTIGVRRRRLGMTQAQLAELAGVSQSYIAKLEARKIEPSYVKVMTIIDALLRLEQKREARASDIMTSDVVGVQTVDTIKTAVTSMGDFGYSQLPVFDGGRPVGSISERTIVDRIANSEDDESVIDMPVSEVMDEAFPQVGEDAPLTILTGLLRIYPAVLVFRRGEVAGIITKADLLKTLS